MGPSKRLFVGNVHATSKDELMDIFSRHGQVVDFFCANGFGFVEFAELEQARQAMVMEQGRKVAGKYLGTFSSPPFHSLIKRSPFLCCGKASLPLSQSRDTTALKLFLSHVRARQPYRYWIR